MTDELTYSNTTRILEARINKLVRDIPSVEIDRDRVKDYLCLLVNPDDLMRVMETIANWDEIPMNYLRCITGIDQLTHLEVVYIFASIPGPGGLAVVARCPRKDGVLPSVYGIWEAADYQERETYEFFGVKFDGHPDLRRLLTHDEMNGHPLLKDYPKGGDPDDLKAIDAFLPDGWLEDMKIEKERLQEWLQEEIAKRTET